MGFSPGPLFQGTLLESPNYAQFTYDFLKNVLMFSSEKKTFNFLGH